MPISYPAGLDGTAWHSLSVHLSLWPLPSSCHTVPSHEIFLVSTPFIWDYSNVFFFPNESYPYCSYVQIVNFYHPGVRTSTQPPRTENVFGDPTLHKGFLKSASLQVVSGDWPWQHTAWCYLLSNLWAADSFLFYSSLMLIVPLGYLRYLSTPLLPL